tara:strand:+ start:775 stop:1383 length:609 start_codon:yes stop_codon:yes gene_type:complete
MDLHFRLKRSNNSFLSDCIVEYEDVFSEDWCKLLIAYFENSKQFRTDDHRKQADQMQLIGDPRNDAQEFKNHLFEKLYPLGTEYEEYLHSLCHDDYKPFDRPLTDIYNTGFRSLQVQKYSPEDKGYPAVHVESGKDHYKKYLAVIVYLNDTKEGQTVFPMAGTAITPETGNVVIWPAGLPFYHCGLKSKNTKYIVTTWFEFK